MKRKILIFSTRYLEEDSLSIFGGIKSKRNDAIALSRAKIELAQICVLKEEQERLLREGKPIKAEQIKEFLSSLFRIGIDNQEGWNMISDALCRNQNDDELNKRKGNGYTPAIWKYLKNHSLSDNCILELSSFLLSEGAGNYYEKEAQEGDCIYRVIGVPYLYMNRRQYAKMWARVLIDCFIDEDCQDTVSMILCLHGSTDWYEDSSGYKESFSKELSEEYSSLEMVRICTFHHEPDSNPIAKALHSKQNSFSTIWSDIINV